MNAAPVNSALQAHTLQEYLDQTKHATTDNFGFPRHGGGFDYYTPQQIWHMATKAMCTYQAAGLPSTEPQVVGLRAVSSADFAIAFLSIVRLGHTVLVLWPTLDAAKVGVLMDKTNSRILISGAKDANAFVKLGKTVIPLATVQSLGGAARGNPTQPLKPEDAPKPSFLIKDTDPAIIIHTSGSTGNPKPVPKTHAQIIRTLRTVPPSFIDKSLFCGPWIHFSVGLYAMLYSFAKQGGPTYWASETSPPTPGTYRDIMLEIRPQLAWFNPVSLMATMATPEGVEALQKCIVVSTAGNVFPDQLGDRLVQVGVRLTNEYGMSELSFSLSSAPRLRRPGDLGWQYLEADPVSAPHIRFRPLPARNGGAEQLYELVVLPSHPTQDKRFANMPDGSFRTGDVFVKHPSAERYKCMGRMGDDVAIYPGNGRIVLNAVSYEHAVLAQNEDILQEVLLFGNGRTEAGMLLFTKPGCVASSAEVLRRVWATVERQINGVLPAVLRKEMLVIVRDEVLPYTAKGSIVRPELYKRFESVINAAYGL
ncbi:hypothetical protein MFIFM68171_06540 [Madurella fahalii]|uniref:AMP-dependent synthetase/ligase domain-containing protein n=1 Tax=Madurella fahalii TaxID=1157608 RepID=A0ABQ0GF60_9PEZI